MKTKEQMSDTRTLLRNASVVIFGGVCAILMTNIIFNHIVCRCESSVIPGFGTMANLCYPLLYFWSGVLLRICLKKPQWWTQIIVLCISCFCLYRYRHFAENWWFAGNLYFALAGIGYLVPTRTYVSIVQNKGWISLIMLLISVFCYTTLTIVKDRLLRGPIIPKHPDMELMMETILVNAEPLMLIIVIYFAIYFAFSNIAQTFGARYWFRGLLTLPCIFTFAISLINLLSQRHFYSIYMISSVYYMPLLEFIVQPITIYLTIFIVRCWRNHRKPKEERLSLKELI